MSRQAPNLKLGQSPLPSQGVLMLIAGIIHGRLVLDVSLTPLPLESSVEIEVGMKRVNIRVTFTCGPSLSLVGYYLTFYIVTASVTHSRSIWIL